MPGFICEDQAVPAWKDKPLLALTQCTYLMARLIETFLNMEKLMGDEAQENEGAD